MNVLKTPATLLNFSPALKGLATVGNAALNGILGGAGAGAGKADPKQVAQQIGAATDFKTGAKLFQQAAPGLGLDFGAQQKIIEAANGSKEQLAQSVAQIGGPDQAGGAGKAGGSGQAGGASGGGSAPPASKSAGGGSAAGACGKGGCPNGQCSGGSCGRCNGCSNQGQNALNGSNGCPNGQCGGQGIPTEKFLEAREMLMKNGGKMDDAMAAKLKSAGLPDNFISYFKQPHVQKELEKANEDRKKAEDALREEGAKKALEEARQKEGPLERAGRAADEALGLNKVGESKKAEAEKQLEKKVEETAKGAKEKAETEPDKGAKDKGQTEGTKDKGQTEGEKPKTEDQASNSPTSPLGQDSPVSGPAPAPEMVAASEPAPAPAGDMAPAVEAPAPQVA